MKISLKYQSVAKPNNDIFENDTIRQNEDQIHIDEKHNIYGLADGAGGSGLFSSKWAKTLLENLPKKPIKTHSGLNDWVEGFWEEFYLDSFEKIKDDPFLTRKFEEEGSLSTICAVWIVDKKIKLMSYGDSAIFIYNKKEGKLKIQPYLKKLEQFNSMPNLINWKDKFFPPSSFYYDSERINENNIYILASDALAQMIYTYYLASDEHKRNYLEKLLDKGYKQKSQIKTFLKKPHGDFKDFLEKLFKSTESEREFQNYTDKLNKINHLVRDDYSLLILEIEK